MSKRPRERRYRWGL